jgi:putative colanic acid biosynthesis glycosyltransferase
MLFSIVTVTRNNLPGLRATAASIEIQSCRDFEWIVIDGDSGDGTKDYLSALPARALSESDNGIYDAMNKGIDRAGGEYLLFLNAGDRLATPQTLKNMMLMLEGEDFAYGDSLENGHVKPARPRRKILHGMITHHQAMFYRRGAVGPLRYDTRYRIASDYKFTLEFLKKTESALYCPFPVCIFEPGGLSQANMREGRIEQFRIREELRACPRPLNAALYAAQTGLATLRQFCPGLYWMMKTARRI